MGGIFSEIENWQQKNTVWQISRRFSKFFWWHRGTYRGGGWKILEGTANFIFGGNNFDGMTICPRQWQTFLAETWNIPLNFSHSECFKAIFSVTLLYSLQKGILKLVDKNIHKSILKSNWILIAFFNS